MDDKTEMVYFDTCKSCGKREIYAKGLCKSCWEYSIFDKD